jgi:hypothetical protein
VTVYDPTTSTTPVQTFASAASVPLTLSDHPVILMIPPPDRRALR